MSTWADWREKYSRNLKYFILGDVAQHLQKPLQVSFLIPGICDVIFSKDDKYPLDQVIALTGLLHTTAVVRPTSSDGSNAFQWSEITRNNMVFAAFTQVEMSRDLYSEKVSKVPLKATVALGHIGKSSSTFVMEVFVPGSVIPMLRCLHKVVQVNPQTRRATSIPAWYHQKFSNLCVMKSPLTNTEKFQRPETTYVEKMEVCNSNSTHMTRAILQSHTDNYQHTNYTVYARFATDTVHKAVLSKEKKVGIFSASSQTKDFENQSKDPLPGITREIVDYGVKFASNSFYNECLEGDIVDVHIWSDKNLQIKCSIEKGDIVCCQIILEYFPPLSSL